AWLELCPLCVRTWKQEQGQAKRDANRQSAVRSDRSKLVTGISSGSLSFRPADAHINLRKRLWGRMAILSQRFLSTPWADKKKPRLATPPAGITDWETKEISKHTTPAVASGEGAPPEDSPPFPPLPGPVP